jgi:AraC-like DNA-binding protein
MPLHRLHEATGGTLGRVRALASALAGGVGHTPVLFPDLCVYRFPEPSTFRKGITFGVTLGVALQGSKRVTIGEREVHVGEEQLLVITRDVEHESLAMNAGPERPYLGMSLCFAPDRVARALLALSEAGGPKSDESIPAFVMTCDEPIAGALERLLLATQDPLDRLLLAPLAIDEILFRLLRSPAAAAIRSAVGRGPDSNRILESMHYIRAHHSRKLSVEELARQVAMSSSHFAHRFRAVVRISPMRYLREVRLDRARTLLLENGARVSDVALQVGFESPAHFTREFKRRYGMSPSKIQ